MDDCGHKDIDKEHGEDDNYHQFQCGMCLELCFKPIVHACGHLFCFWCVHSAMNVEGISLCPMCRSPYTQFPRICELLHRLLGAAFRKKYEQRRKEIQEMETASKVFSPGALMEKDTDEAVTAADLPCELCSKILHRPVVLNCGHAFCQACLTMPPADEAERPKCPSCAMPQRIIPVQVCLELNDYIRHTFPEESKQRDDEVKDLRSREGSTVVASSSSSSSSSSSCSHSGGDDGGLVLVHCCVGCDGCGVYPIIGSRYQCKECPERIGYDLCGDCFAISSAPVGRFNQKHTAEHRMELVNHLTALESSERFES